MVRYLQNCDLPCDPSSQQGKKSKYKPLSQYKTMSEATLTKNVNTFIASNMEQLSSFYKYFQEVFHLNKQILEQRILQNWEKNLKIRQKLQKTIKKTKVYENQLIQSFQAKLKVIQKFIQQQINEVMKQFEKVIKKKLSNFDQKLENNMRKIQNEILTLEDKIETSGNKSFLQMSNQYISQNSNLSLEETEAFAVLFKMIPKHYQLFKRLNTSRLMNQNDIQKTEFPIMPLNLQQVKCSQLYRFVQITKKDKRSRILDNDISRNLRKQNVLQSQSVLKEIQTFSSNITKEMIQDLLDSIKQKLKEQYQSEKFQFSTGSSTDKKDKGVYLQNCSFKNTQLNGQYSIFNKQYDSEDLNNKQDSIYKTVEYQTSDMGSKRLNDLQIDRQEAYQQLSNSYQTIVRQIQREQEKQNIEQSLQGQYTQQVSQLHRDDESQLNRDESSQTYQNNSRNLDQHFNKQTPEQQYSDYIQNMKKRQFNQIHFIQQKTINAQQQKYKYLDEQIIYQNYQKNLNQKEHLKNQKEYLSNQKEYFKNKKKQVQTKNQLYQEREDYNKINDYDQMKDYDQIKDQKKKKTSNQYNNVDWRSYYDHDPTINHQISIYQDHQVWGSTILPKQFQENQHFMIKEVQTQIPSQLLAQEDIQTQRQIMRQFQKNKELNLYQSQNQQSYLIYQKENQMIRNRQKQPYLQQKMYQPRPKIQQKSVKNKQDQLNQSLLRFIQQESIKQNQPILQNNSIKRQPERQPMFRFPQNINQIKQTYNGIKQVYGVTKGIYQYFTKKPQIQIKPTLYDQRNLYSNDFMKLTNDRKPHIGTNKPQISQNKPSINERMLKKQQVMNYDESQFNYFDQNSLTFLDQYGDQPLSIQSKQYTNAVERFYQQILKSDISQIKKVSLRDNKNITNKKTLTIQQLDQNKDQLTQSKEDFGIEVKIIKPVLLSLQTQDKYKNKPKVKFIVRDSTGIAVLYMNFFIEVKAGTCLRLEKCRLYRFNQSYQINYNSPLTRNSFIPNLTFPRVNNLYSLSMIHKQFNGDLTYSIRSFDVMTLEDCVRSFFQNKVSMEQIIQRPIIVTVSKVINIRKKIEIGDYSGRINADFSGYQFPIKVGDTFVLRRSRLIRNKLNQVEIYFERQKTLVSKTNQRWKFSHDLEFIPDKNLGIRNN